MAIAQTAESTEDVVILIPTYNEGSVVKGTIEDIPKSLSKIVCVNDGSQDDTKDQILQTRAHLISHAVNLGQGAALQTAIEYALLDEKSKYFVTYDSDGQHNIKDVMKMVKVIKSKDLDIVLGSRFLGTVVNVSFLKRIVLKIAVKFTNMSTGIKLTDTHNGLRVFNRRTAEKLKLQMPDFAHASEIIQRIAEENLKYQEVPVTITYTDYSRSKGQSMINAINIIFDVVLGKVVKQ